MPQLNNSNAILEAYKLGVRHFCDLELSGENFDGQQLQGIIFERCYLYSSFRKANLNGARFLNSNIKTCDFTEADLTNGHFQGLVVDGAVFAGAHISGLVFIDNYCFGMPVSYDDLQ